MGILQEGIVRWESSGGNCPVGIFWEGIFRKPSQTNQDNQKWQIFDSFSWFIFAIYISLINAYGFTAKYHEYTLK